MYWYTRWSSLYQFISRLIRRKTRYIWIIPNHHPVFCFSGHTFPLFSNKITGLFFPSSVFHIFLFPTRSFFLSPLFEKKCPRFSLTTFALKTPPLPQEHLLHPPKTTPPPSVNYAHCLKSVLLETLEMTQTISLISQISSNIFSSPESKSVLTAIE